MSDDVSSPSLSSVNYFHLFSVFIALFFHVPKGRSIGSDVTLVGFDALHGAFNLNAVNLMEIAFYHENEFFSLK